MKKNLLIIIACLMISLSAHAEEKLNTSKFDTKMAVLHGTMKITPAQENAWQQVVTAMREMKDAISKVNKERREKGESITALDRMKFKSELASIRLKYQEKMLAIFTPFYNSLSPAQKAIADKEFDRVKKKIKSIKDDTKMNGTLKVPAALSDTNKAPSAP